MTLLPIFGTLTLEKAQLKDLRLTNRTLGKIQETFSTMVIPTT